MKLNFRLSFVALLAATLVLAGGGCVSYSGCRTQEDRVRARYEQHFILPEDSSSTAFWKNTKHVFFDVITCCFHEIWRGNARRAYRRMVQGNAQKQVADSVHASKREDETGNVAKGSPVNGEEMSRQDVAVKETATDTDAKDTSSTPILGNAIGMVKRWDERREAAYEIIRKERYKNDEEGFKRFREYTAPSDAARRNSLIRYEEEQTQQFKKVQNTQSRQSDEERQRSVSAAANATALSELAEKRRTAEEKYEKDIDGEREKRGESESLNDTERKAVEDETGNSGQRTSSDDCSNGGDGRPVLGNAIGMTERWQKRNEKSLQKIKETGFGGDEARFHEWYASKIPKIAKERENLIRYEQEQTRQFKKIQNEASRQQGEKAMEGVCIAESNAAQSEFAEKRRSEQSKRELDEKAQERDRRLDEIQKVRDDALAKAKEEYDARLAANRQRLRDWYEESLRKETKFQQSCGLAGETGFNIAVGIIGKDAKAMLCALVDAGQADFVQTFLDELSKPDAGLQKVLRKDAQGNVLKDAKGRELFDWEYYPQGRLCMSLSQVKEVQDYLDERVQAEEARKRRAERRDWEMGKSDEARQGPGTGTGWFMNGKCVATCWHVVKGAKTVKVEFSDGRQSSAQVIAKDEASDVAVLEVKNPPKGQPSLPIRTRGVRVADKAFTVGYPLPDLLGQAQKYTEGSVSAMDGIAGDSRHFQISTPIQPGNSGGPLADESGRVIGLTSGLLNAVKTAQATGALPQNVNYAIKARYLAMVLDDAGIDYATQGSDSDADRSTAVERVMKATCLVVVE